MRTRWWLVVGLSLACGPRQVTQTDEVGEGESSSSSESSTSDSDSTGDTAESSSESGPMPDVPDDLPDECVPVNFLDERSGVPTDEWAGWVHCKDSFFRIEAIDCPHAAGFEICENPDLCGGCDPDEQCLDWYGGGSGYCFCGHNCMSDADCGANEVCACRSGIVENQLTSRNRCLPADCAGQTDCPAVPDETAPRCRLGLDLCGGLESVHCRTDVDGCTYEDDCRNNWCRYDPGDELWSCDEPAICE